MRKEIRKKQKGHETQSRIILFKRNEKKRKRKRKWVGQKYLVITVNSSNSNRGSEKEIEVYQHYVKSYIGIRKNVREKSGSSRHNNNK